MFAYFEKIDITQICALEKRSEILFEIFLMSNETL